MAEQKSRKWIVWVVVAVLAFAALISLTTHRQAAPVVPVAAVTRDNLVSSISSNGKVEPIAPAIAYAQFPTFVREVKATEGQPVKKGQLILVLDSADIRSQLSQARADLISAQSDLKNATGGGPPDEFGAASGRPFQGANAKWRMLERSSRNSKAAREESGDRERKWRKTTLRWPTRERPWRQFKRNSWHLRRDRA